jgi:hypothetical protein
MNERFHTFDVAELLPVVICNEAARKAQALSIDFYRLRFATSLQLSLRKRWCDFGLTETVCKHAAVDS